MRNSILRPHAPRRRTDAEMDVTPMIDMVFLLLIFFMVCSTMDRTSSVHLPPAFFGSAVSPRFSTVITVDGEGPNAVIYLGDGTHTLPLSGSREEQEDAVTRAVEEAYREGRTAVILKAARGLRRGEVARIEAAIARAGAVTLHIAVFEQQGRLN